jgi:hypothetical protein
MKTRAIFFDAGFTLIDRGRDLSAISAFSRLDPHLAAPTVSSAATGLRKGIIWRSLAPTCSI